MFNILVRCDGDLHLDDEKRIEKSIVEHDVVFVVEERKCMEQHKDKLARIAQKISQEQRFVTCLHDILVIIEFISKSICY